MIKRNQYLLFAGLFLVGIISRLAPHIPNVTSVAAISLFAGAILGSRFLAIAVPVLMMFASDLVINNTISRAFFPHIEGFVIFDSYMFWVYLGIIVTVLIGEKFLKNRNAGKLFIGSIGATLVFWVLSNIGAWISMDLWPKNSTGLMACYAAAIPFLRNSLMGDLVFTLILFGVYDYYLSGSKSSISFKPSKV